MDRQKMTTTILLVLEAGLLIIVLLIGVISGASDKIKRPQGDSQSEQHTDVDTEDTDATELESETGTQLPQTPNDQEQQKPSETRETFSEVVEQKLLAMTVEEKILQLFIVSPEAITGVDRVTVAGNGTKTAINQYPVGGIVYAQKNFIGRAQAENLINGAQGYMQERIALSFFVMIREDAQSYVDLATVPSDFIICNYTTSEEIIAAIKGDADMIYAPDNFVEVYGVILAAVNDGTISQIRLENAVGRVLTEKME